MKRLHRGAGESELWLWNTHLLCIWAWINSIIISGAVIMCPSICRAMVGPTLLQTAGAAHHLTADSYGRCDPNLPRLGRPSAGLQAVRAKANKPANLWTRRRVKTTWRRRWRRGWWMTDGSTLFSLAGVGRSCCLSFFFMSVGVSLLSLWRTDFLSLFLLILSSHFSAPLSHVTYYKRFIRCK